MRQVVCGVLVLCSLAAGAAQVQQAPQAPAQEKLMMPPPGVTTEGIPPIPQSVADGFEKYAQFRMAQLIGWNPTKRQILITTALGPVTQLYSIDGPGRDRHQLTWFERGMPVSTNASFDPTDANSFVFQFDPGGSTELRSLYRYDMTTGEIALVTESKTRYMHVWSRQGKWLAYDSAERNGKDRDLYVIQPADPKTKRRLAEFDGPYAPEDWSPDGTTLLSTEIVSNREVYIWRVDVKTGQKKAVTPRDGEKAAWYNVRFSSDGKKIYAVSDRQGGDFRVWRCDVANCTWSPVTPDGSVVALGGTAPGSTGGFEISPDGTVMAVVVDKGPYTDLQIIDLTTLKPRAIPALPKGTVQQLRWRPGSKELGYTLASLKSQGDAYSLDVALGTQSRWTTSETTFNPDVLPAPEVVDFKSFDGTTINAIVYRPPSKFTGPRPVIVQFHGGPDLRERVRWLGRSNYLLNELGIALVFPNVRGSTGFGRQFAEMDNAKGRDGVIKDVGALLDWIAARPDLDKNRVMFGGGSYGGWLALEAGIVYNSRIRGIFEGAGITDMVSFLEKDTNAARQNNRRAEYGDERDPEMRAYLTSISPITRAADLKKPTFILQPGKDFRVPVSQARELVNALKANNAPVWYAEFADADHDNFPGSIPANDWVLHAWVAFFKAYLLN
jgi:dipeptidyl aminopeptidase/acylaminoacyl peptidase